MMQICLKERFRLAILAVTLVGLAVLYRLSIQVITSPRQLIRINNDTNVNSETNYKQEFKFIYTQDSAHEEASRCSEKYNDTFEDNLRVVQNYPRGVADKYLPLLGDDQPRPTQITEYPVIVTAFNDAYYPLSQGLFRSIHILMDNPKYRGKIKCLAYDLGNKKNTIETLKNKSRCEIRRFPFEDFPEHVKHLKKYAFKPIIVQRVLMDYGFLWWADSMIRVNATNFDLAVNYLKKYGWIYTATTSDRIDLSLTRQTHPRMFKFLGEDPCKFQPFGEIWASNTLIHYDRVTRIVVRAWVSCALNEDCIAPAGSRIICDMKLKYDGRCHRYDQSMLGIIARRLYHVQHQYPLDYRLESIYRMARGEIIHYF